MHRRTARLNRVLFVLIGLVLLGAGGFLLARHYDLIDALPSTDRIYSGSEARWLHDHERIWIAVAAVAGLVGLIAVWWLLVQPRIDRIRVLHLDPDPDQPGRTSMAADVFTDAIEDDLTGYPGIARARVLLIGDPEAPQLVLRIAAHPAGDMAAVRDSIVTDALPAVRTALDAAAVPTQVHLLVGRRSEDERRTVE